MSEGLNIETILICINEFVIQAEPLNLLPCFDQSDVSCYIKIPMRFVQSTIYDRCDIYRIYDTFPTL
jgi:hypothetical protein